VPLLELGSSSWRPKNCEFFNSDSDFVKMSVSGIGFNKYGPETLLKELPFFHCRLSSEIGMVQK
jgi:hypothetical protein